MDTSKLKKMAQYIRRQLMNFIEAKIEFILDANSIERRESKTAIEALEGLINEIGKEQVVEKVAYTWFNRFCALRYMEVNHYSKINVISPVLGQFQPEVLAEAKMGYFDENVVSKQNIEKIKGLLNNSITSNDPQRDTYKILIVSYCNYYHKQMPFLFEKINDYTELLMPEDLLSGNSVLAYIREALTPDICKNVEVIGWLYQYYISEKKDEVFADLKKGKKISKENVPAATQIFTPKWIVSYMVENSVGKLWLESHPDNKLQSQFKYYLESAEQEDDVKAKLEELKNKDLKPQDIKVLDPACGSGHILVTAFSVLFEIYKSIGYQENEIPEMILKNNLYGLDICDRAAQLAQFAVMMKAREYDRNIFNKVKDLHICSIKDTDWIDVWVEKELLQGVKDEKYAKEQIDLLKNTFRDAKEYGSILDVKGIDFDFWEERLTFIRNLAQQQNNTPKIKGRLPYTLKQARIMQQQYECVISNPPYMGNKGMSSKLSEYVKKNYKKTKTDFFAVFMEKNYHYTKKNGYTSMITQPSWLFLSSFEDLRTQILDNQNITSLLHMGRGIFGIDFGSCAFTFRKAILKNYNGAYFRLHQRTFQYINPEDIANLYITAKQNHDFVFDFSSYKANADENDKEEFENSKPLKIYYEAKQTDFHSIPGSPIAYWASDRVREIFKNEEKISDYADVITGMTIGDNNLYMRFWYESNINRINFNEKDYDAIDLSEKIWIPYLKGGGYRKWYGLYEFIVNWAQSANFNRPKTTMKDKYLLKGITWSFLTSYAFSARFFNYGFLWDVAGSPMFLKNNENLNYICGLLATNITRYFLNLVNPTLNFQAVEVAAMPLIFNKNLKIQIDNIVEQNIQISKDDWDSFETSWDFEQHPLLRYKENGKVEDSFNKWKEYKQEQFNKLKANEEELNRLFIEIYGLQDEMTPEVYDKDITVRKADEIREIESLMSYAVGCMLGRYSLDKKGLVFAGGEFNKDNYKTFKADDDAIIPILSEHYFSDDITERFKKFIKIAFGDKYYEENLEYIASVLGKKNNETADDTIRNYFLKDFYNDHVKRYQKRPIYWLFSSKNGNFNALIYLHRYNKDTVNRILNNYLREYRGKLEQSIHNDKQLLTSSASDKDKSKAQKEIEIAQKIVNEVTDYERDILYPLATERKEIDLDDGVKVNYLKFGKALKDIGLKAKK